MTTHQLKIRPKSFLNICRCLDSSGLDFWKDPMAYFNTRTGAVAAVASMGQNSVITVTFESLVDKTMFMLYYSDLIEGMPNG